MELTAFVELTELGELMVSMDLTAFVELMELMELMELTGKP
jgi:hypothetical protein